jgi:hypothetical protein
MPEKLKKGSRGGARPGSGPKRNLASIQQRLAIGAEFESRWLALRRQGVHEVAKTGEGGKVHFAAKRPYGARAQVIDDVARWASETYGVAVTPRAVRTCLGEYRRFLVDSNAPLQFPKAKRQEQPAPRRQGRKRA